MYFDPIDPPHLHVYQILWSFSFSLILPPLSLKKKKKMTHTKIIKDVLNFKPDQKKKSPIPSTKKEKWIQNTSKYFLNKETICN